MNQSTHIKIPLTLHAQLKALAAARGTTMTGVIHRAVTDAIAAGEIAPELPGFDVKIALDLDVEPGEIVSLATVSTTVGDWPAMSGDELAMVAEALGTIQPNPDPKSEPVDCTLVQGGRIEIGFRGTAIEIQAHHRDKKGTVRNILAVAGARDLARQLEREAKKLTA